MWYTYLALLSAQLASNASVFMSRKHKSQRLKITWEKSLKLPHSLTDRWQQNTQNKDAANSYKPPLSYSQTPIILNAPVCEDASQETSSVSLCDCEYDEIRD